ncbi:MAG: DUF5666 domain-containing protein [Myxococcales bacterium]
MRLTNTTNMRPDIIVARIAGSTDSIYNRLTLLFGVILLSLLLACAPGVGDTADNGGMSGTGISKGEVTAFGSIYVNGFQWNISDPNINIVIDDEPADATDLRLGMVVTVRGNYQTGIATMVDCEYSLEGPLEADPVDVVPGGPEKSFEILGRTIVIHEVDTEYAGGASFTTLVAGDVVEISGFTDDNDVIQATLVEKLGDLSTNNKVSLHDVVSNLIKRSDGTGSFNLGSVLVSYTAPTIFEGITAAGLMNGDFIEAEGTLQPTGDELEAAFIDLEDEGLGTGNADHANIQGIVSGLVSDLRFSVDRTEVDATNAVFEPLGFIAMDGSPVEVQGRLVDDVLVADRVQSTVELENVRIEAAVASIDTNGSSLSILGLTVFMDGQTKLKDSRDEERNFRLADIQPGDWLKIRGRQTGTAEVLATRIEREDADTDVSLEGPVTSLDVDAPSLSIVDQLIPLDVETRYFDSDSAIRTQEEFFRIPGDVMLGDVVEATDISAEDPEILGKADEVGLE